MQHKTRLGKSLLTCLSHAAAACLYAAAYNLLRDVSVSHWFLPAGLRLLCLLFMPYRYWPALAVGESLALWRHRPRRPACRACPAGAAAP